MNLYEAVEELKKETKPMFAHVKKAVENASLTDYALIIREAGSGKTRIGTEIIRNNLSDSAYILWICPAALLEQTPSDLEGDGIPVEVFTSSTIQFPKGKVIMASYDMVKTRVKQFTSVKWDTVICDEFHRTRNRGTITNKLSIDNNNKARDTYQYTETIPWNLLNIVK